MLTTAATLKYTADWYLAHRDKKDMYKFTVDQIKRFMVLNVFFLKRKNLVKFHY